ncbi:MAG: hypothetical protein ABW136_08190 [Steroidobacteraceae bacterium]
MTQLKDSAKMARDFLSMISDGISRVESGAGALTRSGAAQLARHLPKRFYGGRGPSVGLLSTLVVGAVVAGTAALVYRRLNPPTGRRRSRR